MEYTHLQIMQIIADAVCKAEMGTMADIIKIFTNSIKVNIQQLWKISEIHKLPSIGLITLFKGNFW